tara:strand:- start:28243 stop:28983 length:741 start_codon:yes stop_codon:yes gene_type:complete
MKYQKTYKEFVDGFEKIQQEITRINRNETIDEILKEDNNNNNNNMSIFEQTEKIESDQLVCHSGGAKGSDTIWENITDSYGGSTKAYSYQTKYHNGSNKVEISESDYQEGVREIHKANKFLKRNVSYYMNLLARNWSQVKYSEQIFAIGYIVEPGEKGTRYVNKSKYQEVDGGTGYCVKMGIVNGRPIYVFEQNLNKWFEWSYVTEKYIECETPVISKKNFAGVGTRNITQNGINAIKELFEKTFK